MAVHVLPAVPDPDLVSQAQEWAQTAHDDNNFEGARSAFLKRVEASGGSVIQAMTVFENAYFLLKEGENADAIENLVAQRLDWANTSMDEAGADWLIDGVLVKNGANCIYGWTGCGKSTFAIHMCAAASLGREFLGSTVSEPLRVLYYDKERPKETAVLILHEAGYRVGKECSDPDDLSNFGYYSFLPVGPLDTSDGAATLIALAQREKADLVVVDTAGKVVQGDEMAPETWRNYAKFFLNPMKELGITTLTLDHEVKSEEGANKGQRGSGAKGEDMECVWRMKNPGGDDDTTKREMLRKKRRYAWVPEKWELDFSADADHPTFSRMEEQFTLSQERAAGRLEQMGVPITASRTEMERIKSEYNKANPDAPLTCGNTLFGPAQRYRKKQARLGRQVRT